MKQGQARCLKVTMWSDEQLYLDETTEEKGDRMKITVLDGHTLNPGDLSWDRLEALGEVKVYERTPAHLIVERAKHAEVILTNKTPLTEETIRQLPRLQYVGVLATGYDVVDVQACARRNVVVTHIPAYGTDSVAQYVFALILELCHHIAMHSDSVKKGEWSRSEDWCYWRSPLVELAGKTLGIIGLGRIGLRTAEIASAFGMNVVAYVPRKPRNTPPSYIRMTSWPELLQCADFVSLHCPLTPETRGIINRDSLNMMKSTAYIINTARGPLIDERDLAEALNAGRLAGAALDVMSTEPPPADSPLFHAKNCIITPHMAWATKEARERLLDQAVENVHAFIQGQPIHTVHA